MWMRMAMLGSRRLWRVAVVWLAALVLLAPETDGAKAVIRRRFDPMPLGTFYASVWVGVQSTMTLEFGEDFVPMGQVETVFVENAEREPGTVVAVAGQISPTTWRARFMLPHTGIWNGQHNYHAVGPDGSVSS